MPVLLDTTVLTVVLRGRINVEEIWRRIRPGEEEDDGRLDGLRLANLAWPRGVAPGAGGAMGVGGTTLSHADCLIAAAAVGVSARRATGKPTPYLSPRCRGASVAARSLTREGASADPANPTREIAPFVEEHHSRLALLLDVR